MNSQWLIRCIGGCLVGAIAACSGTPVNFPNADTSDPQDQADFTVTLQPGGGIALEQQPIELEDLQASIEQAMAPNQTASITIKADEEVYHGEVIAVMDELRAIEGVKLGIATQPQGNL